MTKAIYTSPQDVENAFYEALERADLEAMMAVWAEDEEIVCIHPGGPRFTGYAEIREAWRRVFAAGTRLHVSLSPPSVVMTPFTAVHSLVEQIGLAGDDSERAPVVATNVYVRGPLGWRMVVHHASPAPPISLDAPKTLH
ncbi:MAG: nuclear transport factor 2 family protein [Rhodocyclales bacterium]|nr:nuclear transport factor 2 family protein [Rhodocyclales bacterium]